ncbi:hypothetical protein [Cellulomonas palmilytica]|uniref:hypothetical protein n=1 Tax=Cellulomonas palmilytica TaxID=2608402 RepID=UPI001F3A6924|nr:hypothetical protein [Cellulomonas palmilytica]UJP40651.1 hypothetical protein F1D97_03870 [Cellulomonas palmilytica]
MTGDTGFRVDSALLRAEAARWDEIAATFSAGVRTLDDDTDVFLWYLDSITAETEWQHEFVTSAVELHNFALRGRDRIAGAPYIGIAGVAAVLRAMADAYDAADDDAKVTFQRGWDDALGAR